LVSGKEQNRKVYRANRSHPLFGDLTTLLRKHAGIDQMVEQILERIGNVTQAYITGDMALGRDSRTVHLILVGEEINLENLDRLTRKAENLIHRKINCTIITPGQVDSHINGRSDVWKIWGNDQ
jgi:hypothetical protein